jgi:hypothetical protein
VSKQQSLDHLSSFVSHLRNAEDAVEDAVQKARDEGASWSEIGVALGVTRQAAQQRYGM